MSLFLGSLKHVSSKLGYISDTETSTAKKTAYYRDSSGRARVQLKVKLEIPEDGAKSAESLLKSGCIATIPRDVSTTSEDELFEDASFTFECKMSSFNSSRANSWALEGVSIVQSVVERTTGANKVSAIVFDVEVAVRGSGLICRDDSGSESLEEGELELCAVLRQKKKRQVEVDYIKGKSDAITAGLLGLELGGGAVSPAAISKSLMGTCSESPVAPRREFRYGVVVNKTSPVRVLTTLIPPLNLTVREVSGARSATGSTLVEITVEHASIWHKENAVVTGVSFHPGQSRLWKQSADETTFSPDGKSMQGGELGVIDMSRRVRWGFSPGSAPELPMLLRPHEAFSTVIQIDAGEDVRSRAFLSPISVNAIMGASSDKDRRDLSNGGEPVLVTTDIRWTSSRVGIENSDAFRVDMALRGGLEDTVCRVGAPVVVSLRVLNLSLEPRDLMLLMAKDGEGRNAIRWERPSRGKRRADKENRDDSVSSNPVPSVKESSRFNTAVVSEVNGYTFGVWGLSGDEDGTTRHHRDHNLLAVDAALLLGEVKGQHSIEAELRFVPLTEGTLDVPNLKLYDKRGMKWYNCVHTLKIVAASKEEIQQ